MSLLPSELVVDSVELLAGELALEELELSTALEFSVEDESPVILSLIPEMVLLSLLELEAAAELELALLELLFACAAIVALICLYSEELTRTNVIVELLPRPVMEPPL